MKIIGRQPETVDRIAQKTRPPGRPLIYQTWGKLLFIHWPVPVKHLRRHVPLDLEIDTYESTAWLAITPFTVWDVRPSFLPPIPGISSFHEINVRTYVYKDGVPGVWFFSLDANSLFNVLAARTFYHLPYKSARIDLVEEESSVSYNAERPARRAATFSADWTVTGSMAKADPDSLEFFLTERYLLYTVDNGELYRCRIHHETWPLHRAEIEYLETDLLTANGLTEPDGEPIAFAGGPVHVDVWPIEKLGRATATKAVNDSRQI